ncbi:MAG: hypothetical protein SO063_09480, partial [Eubacteriales bacterium]|nr:hypothetical protein [Eubacteriales bacterium]
MKKLFTILSALLALSLLLSACSGGGSTSATASTTAAATTAADSGAAATTAPSTEAPTAITGFMQEAGQNMPDGFDHSNNWFMDILCEMANITWAELTVPPYS